MITIKPEKEAIERLQTNLRAIRILLGWSSADLADILGVTKETVTNLERGKTTMTCVQYYAISLVLETAINMDEYIVRHAWFAMNSTEDLATHIRQIICQTANECAKRCGAYYRRLVVIGQLKQDPDQCWIIENEDGNPTRDYIPMFRRNYVNVKVDGKALS